MPFPPLSRPEKKRLGKRLLDCMGDVHLAAANAGNTAMQERLLYSAKRLAEALSKIHKDSGEGAGDGD
jgi:hypothetical protein